MQPKSSRLRQHRWIPCPRYDLTCLYPPYKLNRLLRQWINHSPLGLFRMRGLKPVSSLTRKQFQVHPRNKNFMTTITRWSATTTCMHKSLWVLFPSMRSPSTKAHSLHVNTWIVGTVNTRHGLKFPHCPSTTAYSYRPSSTSVEKNNSRLSQPVSYGSFSSDHFQSSNLTAARHSFVPFKNGIV